jgi:hypothetical protein
LERAVFLTVLHRLFVSGSDRAADRWREDYAIAGVAVARSASSLSGDGEAGPGTAATGAGRPRLHEEFKRRIKNADGAAIRWDSRDAVLGVLASGQINMRKVDGWRTLAKTSIGQPIDLAAWLGTLEMPEIASPNFNTNRDSTSSCGAAHCHVKNFPV